jgi:glucosylceramidase
VTIHSETKKITYSGQYWAFAHFSRNIRRGARRFESAGKVQGVDHVAFENPDGQDGQKVVVLTNAGATKTVQVKLAEKVAEVALAGGSVSTLSF